MSLCEKNCEFFGYDFQTKKAICECNVQDRSPLLFNDIINKEKLLNNFVDIKSISNINVMKCYDLLLSKNSLTNNTGNYILLSIISMNVILSLFFYFKGYQKIMNKIKKIMELKNKTNIEINKKNTDISVKKNEKSFDLISHYENNKNYLKTENSQNQSNNVEKNNSCALIKVKKNFDIIKVNNQPNENSNVKKLNKIKIFKNDKLVENYSEYELNTFSYEEAQEKDKRTYFQYYISLLKTNHLLIFTFYPTNDYNSMIIKIYLFLFSFALYYIVNSMFFSDSTMHKIYEDEGIFNFAYFIPIILYSTIISLVINTIMKALSLSEKNIKEIKREKYYEKSEKMLPKIVKCLIIKFICFFIISFILLILFWYYIACFCSVYKNTQIFLIKDTLISYGLSLVYPFFFYLLPGLFRIPILSNKKKCLNLCYKICK